MLRAATVLENEKIGTSSDTVLNLYWSVVIPLIVSVPWLFPNSTLEIIAALRTVINCSAQLLFDGSFHEIICLARFLPLLSRMFSVVETVSNFNSPNAGIFLLEL